MLVQTGPLPTRTPADRSVSSDAHSEHSTPRRPRVQRPKRPGHNTYCAINVHSAPARTHSWRTPPAASPKGSTPALSSNLRANLVAGCRILHSCAGLSRCDNEPSLTMHSCQPTCQADWRVPPTSSATGLMLALWADQINAGRYSLLNRSGVCGPTGHSAGSIRYLSLRSIQHICQAYWRTPPAAHQPGARSVPRTLLIVCETPPSAAIRQVWQKQTTEDQLPTNRCYLPESGLPGGDPWTRQNPSISYLGKLLSRVIICNFVQLSTPNVRHPHARHMQGVEWNTSPSRNNGNARWHSLTLPTLMMLDWLYKSPGNTPHKYMCPLSDVSLGYWMMTIPRGDSGVQWSERWPYKPGPYRIRDFPQYMPWIGLTVSADTAFAPRQSDDSSGSSVEAFHSWISAKCCGACMQTLRTAQPCEGTCLCITCRVTAPPHPHVARPVKPYQQIWMADRADNLNTNVAGNQLKITAKTHWIYARSIPDCIQTSVISRRTALIGLLPCHVSWVVQIHSHIFLCLAAKVSQSLRNIASSAVIVAACEPSMAPHHWPWLTSIFCHRLAAVDNLARGRSLHSMMIHTSIMDTQRRCHSPSHMPGAKFVEVCPLIAALSQALEPQQNCVRAHGDKPCVNGGMLLPPRQVTVSDCRQVKTFVFQGLQLTNIRAGHCRHPGKLGAITHSSEYLEAKARLPKLRRSPPSEAGKSVKVEFSRRMNNPTLSIDIRHQGGAQERASESNTGGATAETQCHARAPLFLAYHGLNQSTGSCRFVHCTSSHAP